MGNRGSSSSSSVDNSTTRPQQQPDPVALENLVAMGFLREHAIQALVRSDNNMDAALAGLLNHQANGGTFSRSGGSASVTASAIRHSQAANARDVRARAAEARSQNWRQNSSSASRSVDASSSNRNSRGISATAALEASAPPRPVVVNAGLGEDAALQKALQMSMEAAPTSRASSSSRSGRDNNTATTTVAHATAPSTKGLKRLANVIAPHPVSMDTLIKIINMILMNPGNPKFRRLKWTNRRVRETIKETPGATDFLKLLGFVEEPSSQSMVLSASNADEAVLLRGLQLLGAQRKGAAYRSAVNDISFKTVMQAVLGRAPDAAEAAKRKVHADRLPVTPEEKQGTNTTLRIRLGDQYVNRRFRTDNTLQAAVDFLGSLSSLVPDKLDAHEWKLVNTTTFPARDVDLETDRRRTFYALEMWPSAELTLEPVPFVTSSTSRPVMRMGSGVVVKKTYD